MTETELTTEIAGVKQLLSAGDGEVLQALEALLGATDADGLVEIVAEQAEALADVLARRGELRELLAAYEEQLAALEAADAEEE